MNESFEQIQKRGRVIALQEADRDALLNIKYRQGLRLEFDADDGDIRRLANEAASICAAAAGAASSLDEALQRTRSIAIHLGVEPPHLEQVDDEMRIHGAIKRTLDPKWWRRRLRVMVSRRVEVAEVQLGRVHRNGAMYCSYSGLYRHRLAKRRNEELLAVITAVNEEGQSFSLDELAGRTTSSPRLRRCELMARVKGLENTAAEHSDAAVFCTWTLPSRFHAVLSKSGQRNPAYDGSTPDQGAAHLAKLWAKVRATLDRLGLKIYGLRVAEPHADATPHWHLLLFTKPEHFDSVKDVLRQYALAESPEEPGAQQHRIRFETIDSSKGSATGYVAKYVSKNIDGHALDDAKASEVEGLEPIEGNDAAQTSERIRCWASIWGIRQFQFIGTPPVTVYRELRRLGDSPCVFDVIEKARLPADKGDYAAHIHAMGGIGIRRADLRVRTFADEAPIQLNQYGEVSQPKPKGVIASDGSGRLVTRHHTWSLVLAHRGVSSNLDSCQ